MSCILWELLVSELCNEAGKKLGTWAGGRQVFTLQRLLFSMTFSVGTRALTRAVIRDCATFHKLGDFRVQCLDQKPASKSTSWFEPVGLFQLNLTEELRHRRC